MIEIRVRERTQVRERRQWIDISGRLLYSFDVSTLADADLSGLKLVNADLAGQSMVGCILRHAQLNSANLDSADLSYAILTNAIVAGASLCNTKLVGADLSQAIFIVSDLRGADLSEAILDGALFEESTYNQTTNWPTGFDPAAAGALLREQSLGWNARGGSDSAAMALPRRSGSHLSLREHPWKTTLMRLRGHFFRYCEPTAVTYYGFDKDVAPLFSPEGERVRAKYALGAKCLPVWWEATFTDTRIEVRGADTQGWTLPYANIKNTLLPAKSELPVLETCDGMTFYSQRAFILAHDGERYEVRGTVHHRGYRDIYLWHDLTAALRDQVRHNSISS